MTLAQLEYALTLSRYKSFSKTAEKLGITQPALSLQIKKLEQEIDIQLFNRTSNPISVTDDGAKFLERCQQILTDARQLVNYSQELKQGYEDTLKVGIIPTLSPFLVPLFANELQRDFPKFYLDIHELTTDKTVEGVRDGSLDVGIISTPLVTPGIHVIPLFYEQFYFYTSEERYITEENISLDKVKYDELWLLDEGNCFRDQINDFCDLKEIRRNKQFVYRSNSIDALIRIVDTKGGMTILPELSTLSLDEQQEEFVKAIKGKPKAREISLITTRHYNKRRFIEKLEEYIKDNVPKHMLSPADYEIVDPQITTG